MAGTRSCCVYLCETTSCVVRFAHCVAHAPNAASVSSGRFSRVIWARAFASSSALVLPLLSLLSLLLAAAARACALAAAFATAVVVGEAALRRTGDFERATVRRRGAGAGDFERTRLGAAGFGFGFGLGAGAASATASVSSTQTPLTASQTLPLGARPRGRLCSLGATVVRERGARFGFDAAAGDLDRARRAAVLALALVAATAVADGERPRGLGEAGFRAGDLLRLARVAGIENCGPFTTADICGQQCW